MGEVGRFRCTGSLFVVVVVVVVLVDVVVITVGATGCMLILSMTWKNQLVIGVGMA
jgi:hypothetical protein